MTKKDYKVIAQSIHKIRSYYKENHKKHNNCKKCEAAICAIDTVIYELAKDLHNDNPRFDHGKFYLATGVQSV